MNKSNFFLILYLGSWSILAIIWLNFLVNILNLNVTFDDVRVGPVVAWGGAAFILSLIPVLHIIICSYWYIRKWRSTWSLIYILLCVLSIVISFAWSSKHISSSIEKNERLYVPPPAYQLNEDDK